MRSDSVFYYAQDFPGNVVGLVNAAQGLVAQYKYKPYGADNGSSPGTVPNPFRFAARQLDSETGLYYMRARYYDPQLGRFVSEDPIGLAGGINAYAYTGDNPVNGRDPSGTCGDWAHPPWGLRYSCDFYGGGGGGGDDVGDARGHSGGGSGSFDLVAFVDWALSSDYTYVSWNNGVITARDAAGNETYWVNPTGGPIRGCDSYGCGSKGAPRSYGGHHGADYDGTPGQDVLAVVSGTVTKIGWPYAGASLRYIEITSDDYVARELYVQPYPGLQEGDP